MDYEESIKSLTNRELDGILEDAVAKAGFLTEGQVLASRVAIAVQKELHRRKRMGQ